MNIKILDSWIKEYLKTKVTPQEFAKAMSLSSVSIEKIEKYENDWLYDIEITTNRVDLMSVVGLAREAAAVLPQFGIPAMLKNPKLTKIEKSKNENFPLTIKNDDTLVRRICAVIMEVSQKPSPKEITTRLEASGIRSLNNIIDVTNYVMRTLGHPTHVFDYDRLKTRTIVIRKSRNNEKIKTLDGKAYTLLGGDIVAEDGIGNIIDLLGVMGLENSVVTKETKRIIFFIDTVDGQIIRKTSMLHGIRTEAAVLNEKNIDPNAAYEAMLYGIELYKDIAEGKMLSNIIDIYPKKQKEQSITVSKKDIDKVIGTPIPEKTILQILTNLGFSPEIKSGAVQVLVPSYRINDVTDTEDIIEEIARIYGYHNIPSTLPAFISPAVKIMDENPFYFEKRIKNAMKYWGFLEVYTNPMISEQMYEGPVEDAVTIKNPLGEEFSYMRKTLVPSLLAVLRENKNYDTVKLFEIANVYYKRTGALPDEKSKFAGVIKKQGASFFEVKGLIEQLLIDLGVNNTIFKPTKEGGVGADVYIGKEMLGTIEVLDERLINFELDVTVILQFANTKKIYKPPPKYPPIFQDISFVIDEDILTGDIIGVIKKQSELIKEVILFDKYQNTRGFHIIYLSQDKNLTNTEVSEIREKIITAVKNKYTASVK